MCYHVAAPIVPLWLGIDTTGDEWTGINVFQPMQVAIFGQKEREREGREDYHTHSPRCSQCTNDLEEPQKTEEGVNLANGHPQTLALSNLHYSVMQVNQATCTTPLCTLPWCVKVG